MGSPNHVCSVSADPCLAVIAKINELYRLRDTYYPENEADKRTKLDSGIKEVLLMIEALGNETVVANKRGHIAYLRGKALDVGPDYSKEAEEQLSKAVSYIPKAMKQGEVGRAMPRCFLKLGPLSSRKVCSPSYLVRSASQRLDHTNPQLRMYGSLIKTV